MTYDPYRQLNLIEEASAREHGWTWSSKQYGNRSRLDYILVLRNLAKFVTHAHISDNQLDKLDHRTIHITINFHSTPVRFKIDLFGYFGKNTM